MTVDQIQPAIGEYYRHRVQGWVGKLIFYRGYFMVFADRGYSWTGDTTRFWNEWIHAGASHEQIDR